MFDLFDDTAAAVGDPIPLGEGATILRGLAVPRAAKLADALGWDTGRAVSTHDHADTCYRKISPALD